jgi:hypothetical protein
MFYLPLRVIFEVPLKLWSMLVKETENMLAINIYAGKRN